MKNRKRKRGFFWYVGFMFTVGFVALVSFTCISIKVKAEKDGTSFGVALVSLFTPQKQVKETYTGAGGELPSLEKISEKQKAEKALQAPAPISTGKKPTAQPVAYSAPSKKATAEEYGVCKSCQHFHDLSKSCADDLAYVNSTVKQTSKPKAGSKNRQTTTKREETAAAPPTPKTVSWTSADNTPRGGRTVGAPRYGDMSQMSDLEKEAAYKARNERSLEKIRQEVQKLRNGEVTPKPKGAIQTAFEYLTGN